jgi:hypothetical protein
MLALALLGGGVFGCGSGNEETACTPGRQVECACPGGSMGIQVCQDDETYGVCDCAGSGSAGSGGSGGTPGAPGDVISRACSTDAACGDGFVCALGGYFAGMCTSACTNTTDCETRFGDGMECVEEYCTRECTHSDECSVNGYCSSGNSICLSGKAGLSETCSTDAQCETGLSCSYALGNAGQCTIACATDAECEILHGGGDCVQSLGFCTRRCYDNLTCTSGLRCVAIIDTEGFSSGYCTD